MSVDPSRLPLSDTKISPAIPDRRRKPIAFRIHVPTVSASFRHGIKMVSSEGTLGDLLPSDSCRTLEALSALPLNQGRLVPGREFPSAPFEGMRWASSVTFASDRTSQAT